MSLTPSNMLALNTALPEFTLIDVRTKLHINSIKYIGDNGLLVMFICNHCPFVIHVQEELSRLGKDFEGSGISITAINSNDIENYPADSPENMILFAKENDFSFPYLFDESQEVAKSFKAACTPDFFLYNANEKLVYRGQLDGARPGNSVELNGKDLRAAMNNLLEGKAIPSEQTPSIGCNIKWKT